MNKNTKGNCSDTYTECDDMQNIEIMMYCIVQLWVLRLSIVPWIKTECLSILVVAYLTIIICQLFILHLWIMLNSKSTRSLENQDLNYSFAQVALDDKDLELLKENRKRKCFMAKLVARITAKVQLKWLSLCGEHTTEGFQDHIHTKTKHFKLYIKSQLEFGKVAKIVASTLELMRFLIQTNESLTIVTEVDAKQIKKTLNPVAFLTKRLKNLLNSENAKNYMHIWRGKWTRHRVLSWCCRDLPLITIQVFMLHNSMYHNTNDDAPFQNSDMPINHLLARRGGTQTCISQIGTLDNVDTNGFQPETIHLSGNNGRREESAYPTIPIHRKNARKKSLYHNGNLLVSGISRLEDIGFECLSDELFGDGLGSKKEDRRITLSALKRKSQ